MDLLTIVENFIAQLAAWWDELVALLEALLGL